MTKNMTSGNPAKLIFLFTIPLIAGNIFQQFYNVADTLIVGRTLGVNALAAVGCTGGISFLILGFITGLASGLAIPTAQRFGAADEAGVKKSFATGIIINLITALVITIPAALSVRGMLELLQTPAEIMKDAEIYLLIIFFGIPAVLLFNFLSNILRALGDSKTPLYFLIIACVLNIILDYVCILVFHMGVAGAGVATIFAQLVSGILCILFIWKKVPILRISREDMRVTRHDIRIHLSVALPMAFQASIIAIGALVLQYALNGLGAKAVAATTTASKIESIATMPLSSFGLTMATYTAQNYGAEEYERIREGVFKCILMSGGYSIVGGLINIFFGRGMATFFITGNEVEVLDLTEKYFRMTGGFYWPLALLFIYRYTLQGLGHGLVPTISGIMELVMRTFAALVLTSMFGFAGASLSGPLAWLGACIPLVISYYYTIHKMIPGKRKIHSRIG